MTEGLRSGYAVSPLVVVIVGLALIVVVLTWAPATRSRILFVGMLAGLVLWGFAILGMRLSDNVRTALAFNRWTPAAIYLMFQHFYMFAREYTGVRGEKHFKAAGCAVLVLSLVAAPLGLLMKDLRVESYGYAPVAGVLAVPLSIAGMIVFLAAVRLLVRRYRTTTSAEERSRLLYLMIAASFPLVGALADVATNLPPLGMATSLIFCIICSIALLEYRLLDIPHVARRTLTYLVLGVMVAVPYVLTVIVLQRVFGARMEGLWGYAVTILFLAVFLRPLYSAAQGLVDRLFYRDRYDALRALEQFGREAQHEVDLDVLCCRLTQMVTDALHATRTYLFLPVEGTGVFDLVSCEGQEPMPPRGSFPQRSALVRWLTDHSEILAHRMLDVEPQLQSLTERDRALLESLHADLLVPVTSATGHLSGLLILAEKRSQRHYSMDDRRLLEALGRQMAIALDNARLYNDALRARHDLERWLDGMSDSVVIVDQSRSIRFVNRSARQDLGVAVGDPCWTVLGSGEACADCMLEDAWDGASDSVRVSRRIGERDYEVVSAQMLGPYGERTLISVLRDVTERRLFEEELRRSREQLRELAVHQESVREDERAGIARELHDELGQLLTALKMDLTWVSRHLPGMPESKAGEKFQQMINLTETSIASVQRMSSQLRPGVLDDLGLVAALEWLAKEFQQRSGTECKVTVDDSLEIGGQMATVLFRICQESLTNVARHSQATKVSITLRGADASVVLSVADNGRGITDDEMKDPRSFGVAGMRERARALGGSVTIVGRPGEGTTVEATLPLDGEPDVA